MSSILEALEKAEVERIHSSDPVLHPLPSTGSKKRLKGPLIAGGLVLLLLMGLLFWWFYLRQEQQPVPPPRVPLSPPPPVAATAPVEKPVVVPQPVQELPDAVQKPTQPRRETPALTLREQLQKSAAPSAKPLFEEAKLPPKPVAAAKPKPPAESPRPALAKGASDTPPVEPDAGKPPAPARSVATAQEPMAPALPIATAEPPLGSQRPEATDLPQAVPAEQIPLVWELSQEVRERVLQLKSSVHVYSQQPEQRFVIINMRRYSEGESLPPHGFRLERIDQDGVVIDHGEGLVRLPRR